MAGTRKYPTPHEQLGVLMVEARREGLSFRAFWRRAIRPGQAPVVWRIAEADRPAGAVVWSNDRAIRATDRGIYEDGNVRAGWQRAYERTPERRDLGLESLREGIAA
jgi:hypothetical protein